MKNIYYNLSSLFYNDKFLMVFSIFFSFVLWCVIYTYSAETNLDTVSISDIPVSVSISGTLKENNYKAFHKDLKAVATIEANRFIAGQMSKSDIQISAELNSDTLTSSAGTYNFKLVPKKNSKYQNYKFISISPENVELLVDRLKEADYEIKDEVKFNSDPKYVVSLTKFASLGNSIKNIKISGPESNIKKISKVAAVKNIEGMLTRTTTVPAEILLYDANGEVIDPDKDLLTINIREVDATIPIFSKKVVNLLPNFRDAPGELDLSRVHITPESVEISGSEDDIKDIDSMKLSELSMSKIDMSNNQFDLQIEVPQSFKILNNISSANLTIDMSGFSSTVVRVNNFSFLNVAEGKKAKVNTANIDVTIVGPSKVIEAIKKEDISAIIDLKGQDNTTSHKEMPAEIKIRSDLGCWAFGSYTADISIN